MVVRLQQKIALHLLILSALNYLLDKQMSICITRFFYLITLVKIIRVFLLRGVDNYLSLGKIVSYLFVKNDIYYYDYRAAVYIQKIDIYGLYIINRLKSKISFQLHKAWTKACSLCTNIILGIAS